MLGFRTASLARFNEAAALLPRKAASIVCAAPLAGLGFNEAAALLPRKASERFAGSYEGILSLQ